MYEHERSRHPQSGWRRIAAAATLLLCALAGYSQDAEEDASPAKVKDYEPHTFPHRIQLSLGVPMALYGEGRSNESLHNASLPLAFAFQCRISFDHALDSQRFRR